METRKSVMRRPNLSVSGIGFVMRWSGEGKETEAHSAKARHERGPLSNAQSTSAREARAFPPGPLFRKIAELAAIARVFPQVRAVGYLMPL